ncbi:DUF2407 C-terminal domain-containing protein [Pyrenochaeta sp. MPI-SDFR-AT-0127]|nr:DUF2407 C-terminal domain-containing protein [Pyrenochaeta sp. MPI-SDFR-AT-0127]
MAANVTTLPEQLIFLIIRFTTAIEDLPIFIHHPRTTTTLSLKQLLRQNLPPDHATARLRLIYAGKVLADTAPLSTSLKLPPPPRLPSLPSSGGTNIEHDGLGTKSKGKQPLREMPTADYGIAIEIPTEANKYYIHCSLGDALSASELDSEATLAQNTEISLKSQYESSQTSPSRRRASTSTTSNDDARRRRSSTTTAHVPQAQGFDRLLSAGFTAAEVASLRSHFQTNLSFTHTPDTMPTPQQMRVLEDRWLDSSANDPSSSLTGTDGGLDDMLWGYMTGFFWPLGSLVWGFREDGVWTRRRQVAVVMGVLINTIFGFMRWSA